MPTCDYGPPISDSDSDDCVEGFYFSDKLRDNRKKYEPYVAPEQNLYDATIQGDLTVVREEIQKLNWRVDDPVKNGFTLLILACYEGYYDIVEYLVVELKANVNGHVDSFMPLMAACDCHMKDASYIVRKMVKLLLKHGAVINVSNKYGMTPFMFACKHGHTDVVRLMIEDVSFDAVDNQGCTPIFHAIENNHAEIVKLLVDAGVNTSIANCKSYTPIQVAKFHGFYDLLDFLPRENDIAYVVPSSFLCYNSLNEQIPRIFLKTECPEYFQEINCILSSIGMQNFLEFFAKSRVPLAEFLVMTDENLEKIGIEYPIYRSKLKMGILDFHLHHWSKEKIARVSRQNLENFYEILMLTANHLQHLVIVQASVKYIIQNQLSGQLGVLDRDHLKIFRLTLAAYRKVLHDLVKTTAYLSSFSPRKCPLYINYDDILAERKRNKVRKFFKYSTIVLGISVVICLKVKRIF